VQETVAGFLLSKYDCEAADMMGSRILIGLYDGFLSFYGLSTTFHQMRLAPDGKIYVSANNNMNYLHVIHHPDRYGLACHFE